MLKHPTDALVEKAFPACTHPDCGGSGHCATDHFHLRARALARLSFARGKRAATKERATRRQAQRISTGWTTKADKRDHGR